MDAAADSLRAIVAAELRQQTPAAVVAMCDEIGRRHCQGIVAILFYGSCLRRSDPAEGVLDFYLLVDDYRRFYGPAMPALANAALPPNVFYAECALNGVTLRAQYAVVSLPPFQAGTRRPTPPPSLWARFPQPARPLRSRHP